MSDLEQFTMLIGGKSVSALSGRTFESQNPYTGKPWAVVPDGGSEDVDAAVAAARAALDGEWGATTGFARATHLRQLGGKITDGDLHRAHRGGGWTVAQVISHINVSTLLWLGDLHRLRHDSELRFFFREEVGHDALG